MHIGVVGIDNGKSKNAKGFTIMALRSVHAYVCANAQI